jgi:hypothetical protein
MEVKCLLTKDGDETLESSWDLRFSRLWLWMLLPSGCDVVNFLYGLLYCSGGREIIQGWMVGWRVLNLKGFVMKESWPNRGTIPAFVWSDWSKWQKKTYFIRLGVPSGIRTEHLPHKNLENYRYSNWRRVIWQIYYRFRETYYFNLQGWRVDSSGETVSE